MPKQIDYDIEQEPIVLSKSLLDILLKQKNPSNLIALYTFYYYTAKWQKTNTPKASTSYVSTGLGWGENKVRKNKQILIGLDLINDVQSRDEETNAITGHYIRVKFIWSAPKTKRIRKSHPHSFPQCGSNHSVGSDTPNALSANSLNALSSNNKTMNKIFITFTKKFHKIQKRNHPKIIKNDLTDTQCIKQATVLSNLVRLDGYDFKEEIRPALLWAADDSFWTDNVKSLASLRNKSKSNELTKFQNIFSRYLQENKTKKKKSSLTDERRKSYKNWEEDED